MKNSYILFLIILLVIIGGFFISYSFPDLSACNLMACMCDNQKFEVPCNSCSNSKPIFVTWIINIIKSCPEKEIILCKDGQEVGKRYDINNDKCEYKLQFMDMPR